MDPRRVTGKANGPTNGPTNGPVKPKPAQTGNPRPAQAERSPAQSETPPQAQAENPWQAQTESMARLWSEAGRNMWQAWADMAQAAAAAPTAATSGVPAGAAASAGAGRGPTPAGGDPMLRLAEQWRQLAEQAMAVWTAGSEPVVKDVASGMFGANDMVFRYTRLITEAWATLGAQTASGQDWTTGVQSYAEQFRRGFVADPAAQAAISGDTADLWRLYLETLGRLTGPWAQSLQQSHGHVSSAMTGDSSAFAQLSRLYWDAWEHTGGRLLESPSLGMTREFEETLLTGFDTWMDYRRAVAEYQTLTGDAWIDAWVAVMEALKARAEAGKPIESLRELTGLWTSVTDASMEEAFRSEPYAAAQGKMLNAAMAYRQAERAVVETLLKMTDIASRGELDEAFHEIYHLRRELRALRQEVAALRTGGQPVQRDGGDLPWASITEHQALGAKPQPAPAAESRTPSTKPRAARKAQGGQP